MTISCLWRNNIFVRNCAGAAAGTVLRATSAVVDATTLELGSFNRPSRNSVLIFEFRKLCERRRIPSHKLDYPCRLVTRTTGQKHITIAWFRDCDTVGNFLNRPSTSDDNHAKVAHQSAEREGSLDVQRRLHGGTLRPGAARRQRQLIPRGAATGMEFRKGLMRGAPRQHQRPSIRFDANIVGHLAATRTVTFRC
jgi:hypothetical protein